jgi:hypothetical protein
MIEKIMINALSEEKCDLIGKWVGDILGTHRCYVFAEWDIRDDRKVIVEIRVPTSQSLVSTFRGQSPERTMECGSEIKIDIYEVSTKQLTGLELKINLKAVSSDELEGYWQGSNDSKGMIYLKRPKRDPHNLPSSKPTEILSREYQFNSLKIYKKDIEEIINTMTKLIGQDGNVFVTLCENGFNNSMLSQEYTLKENKNEEPNGIIIVAQKIINGFNNNITVNIQKEKASTIFVQTQDVVWFNGTYVTIKDLLQKKSRNFINLYKQHGLSINFFFLIALLVYLPGLSLENRAIWAFAFIAFALLNALIHRSFSMSYINQKKDHPSGFKERHPVISYLVLTIASAAITILITFGIDFLTKSNSP